MARRVARPPTYVAEDAVVTLTTNARSDVQPVASEHNPLFDDIPGRTRKSTEYE